MAHPIILDGRVWCPLCTDYVQLLRVQSAARLVAVDRRTIYRYIEAGEVYTIKVAGHTYRVCSSCLLTQKDGSHENIF
jgi:excisionase family DNA binding protein